MPEPNMTLPGGVYSPAKHRHGSFRKVENGFVLKLAVKNGIGDEWARHEIECVFYTAEEFLLSLEKYLSADRSEIGG